jgi:tRNA 5-methylaminomethyl-2-thiouridine biosynthesis bifunctional protein
MSALFLPQSMQMNPAALCGLYAHGIDIRFGHEADPADHDAVIIASGQGALATGLPLHTVRGQATTVRGKGASLHLKTNLCFGGYMSAPYGGGLHMVGSSFQKWLDHTGLLPQDDADNQARLADNVPSLAQDYEVIGARAALRVASRDHFPVAGRMADGAYISAAHGSHGLLSSLAAAELIADLIDGSPASLPCAVQDALSPARFGDMF